MKKHKNKINWGKLFSMAIITIVALMTIISLSGLSFTSK